MNFDMDALQQLRLRHLIFSQAYYNVHMDSGEHVLTDKWACVWMTYLCSKSFKHVPRSISIKGPEGIVSHHLLEMKVYFGVEHTKQQMFYPQQ